MFKTLVGVRIFISIGKMLLYVAFTIDTKICIVTIAVEIRVQGRLEIHHVFTVEAKPPDRGA